jgi:hypothetical protein
VKAGLRAIRADDGGGLGRHYLVGGIVAKITHLRPSCSRETLDPGFLERTMASHSGVTVPLGA